VLYVAYLWVLNRLPPEEEDGVEDIDAVPRFVLRQRAAVRNALIVGLFLAGGGILFVSAHPFLQSMLAMAVALGMSEYVFVQWVSPFLSEFPEKVSAFNWARRQKAPMALMNMISSNINQWTMLAAMIPIAFGLSRGSTDPLVFDEFQLVEIALTIAQSLLGFCLVANMRFAWHEALLLFSLFLAQFAWSEIRVEVAVVYTLWSAYILLSLLAKRRTMACVPMFVSLWGKYVRRRGPAS
jgi:cation:H+ antiporter